MLRVAMLFVSQSDLMVDKTFAMSSECESLILLQQLCILASKEKINISAINHGEFRKYKRLCPVS